MVGHFFGEGRRSSHGSSDHSPGYAGVTELLHRRFGEEVAQSFRAPFRAGDPELLRGLCAKVGLEDAEIKRRGGAARFESPAQFMQAEGACAWSLGGMLDDEQFALLLCDAEEALKPFQEADGTVTVSFSCLVVTATKA